VDIQLSNKNYKCIKLKSLRLENGKAKQLPAISYIITPNAHQSTALLYPLDKIISGARYSGVPQRVQVRSLTLNIQIYEKIKR
jgi:hypothetical protein